MGHLNYAPTTIGDNVDKWHVDTLRYDYVMFVTDPKPRRFTRGTKHEVAALHQAGKPLDPAGSSARPCQGRYAIMQQGNRWHPPKG